MRTAAKNRSIYKIYQQVKFDAEDIIFLIEKKNGAENLDLSGRSLAGIKLNRHLCIRLMRRYSPIDLPSWYHSENVGINLRNINLSWANLENADLNYCCLEGADLRGANLRGVYLIDADLRNAVLWDADLTGATLSGAKLEGANLFGANLNNAYLDREGLGEMIIQECENYHLPKNISMSRKRNRFWQASKIYRALKASFDGRCAYQDASWSYRKTRRVEKILAFHYAYMVWEDRDWKTWFTQSRKYLTDQFVEILADYGESPWLVLFWLIIVCLGFGFIYRESGLVLKENSLTGDFSVTRNVLDIISFSFGTMTTINPHGLMAKDTMIMRFLMPLEVLFGIGLTGLFGFVLGNRINRI